jgi:teichuronic acid biosynthesis glycosyltransferase TuaC
LSGGRSSYWRTIDNLAQRGRPDVVWACSDVPHAVLGVRVAKRIGAPLVIDLYDNFEAYGLTRMPGMRRALQYAIRRSDGVTCVSQPLAELVRERYAYSGAIEVIENAIPSDLFRPGDRLASRSALGLPAEGILVGTAGALSRSRGIECLFAAFERLAAKREDVHLVLAGRLDRHLSPPAGARVHYLGLLPPEQVPVVLAALDVSVISNRESEFGSYCFPQKFYESVAARVPLVVAATGAMRALLREWPDALYEPDDPDSLVAAIERNIEARQPLPLEAPLWSDLTRRLESFLDSVVRGRARI